MNDFDHCKLVNATIYPEGRLNALSKIEVSELLGKTRSSLYQTFRYCALAVLNSGSKIDDGKELLERFPDFDIFIHQEERGVKLLHRPELGCSPYTGRPSYERRGNYAADL